MRTTLDFSPLWRNTIGFDHMLERLKASESSAHPEAYPPYNIEKMDEDSYRITMAVAGFGEDELTVTAEPNLLTVSGDKADRQSGELFYQGIATRSFRRQIQLADHVKVRSASLKNGLLTIELERELPEAMRPRRIKIGSGTPAQKPELVNKQQAA